MLTSTFCIALQGNLNEGQRSVLSRCVAEADFPLGVLNALLALILVMHHDCQILVDGSEIRVVTDRDSFKPTILQKKLGKRPEQLSFEEAMAQVPESMAEHIKSLKDGEEQSGGKEDETGVEGWTGFEGMLRDLPISWSLHFCTLIVIIFELLCLTSWNFQGVVNALSRISIITYTFDETCD